MVASGLPREASGARVLALLLLTYILNLMDRQIVGVLAVPIKSDLGLSDTQLGLLGGLAFVLFYTVLGIPIAWLADRKNRVAIIAVSVGVWSAFTGASGAAVAYWQLFLARVGVGVGEAGGVAPAYSLISDYFPPQRRARALAIFSLGAPIGAALGILFGGWIASNLHWRVAFVVLGAAGLILVPIVKSAIPEPARGRLDAGVPGAKIPEAKKADAEIPAATAEHAIKGRAKVDPGEAAPSFRTVARGIAASPAFWLLSFGAAMSTMPSSGLVFWLPSFLQRSFGLELLDVSIYQGSLMLIGGVFGTWFGGWIGDRVGKGSSTGYALTAAIGFLLAVPAVAAGLVAQTLTAAWFLFLIWYLLALLWLGPTLAAVQHIFPPNTRATASAMFLFINNLIGYGLGTLVMGFMSDQMTARYGDEALRYSMLYSSIFYLVSFVLFGAAAWSLARRDANPGSGKILKSAAYAE